MRRQFLNIVIASIIIYLIFVTAACGNTVSILAEPSSGIAPLEVKLTCIVARQTSTPQKYVIYFGDGSPGEEVESNQYIHTFTHTYASGGLFKPVVTVQKSIGTKSDSKPAKIILAKWRFQTGGDIDSSPAIGPDGTVYVGSDDGNLYAIDPETGEENWRFKTGGEVHSSPAIASDGTIYLGSTDGYLYALRSNGSLKWSFKIGEFIYSSPAIGREGRTIYIGSTDNSLYAISATGALKWKFATKGKIISSPSIGHDGLEDVVYFGSLDNHVYALAADNGQLKWSFATNAGVYGSPAISSDGRIIIGECEIDTAEEYNFFLYCLNVDGTKEWQYDGGAGFYSSPAIDASGNICIGSWDGILYSFSPDGKMIWGYKPPFVAAFNSSPAIGQNDVYFAGCKNGNIYAIQPGKNIEVEDQQDWIFETGDDIMYSSPVIDKTGTIYIGSQDNFLYAINPGNLKAAQKAWPMYRSDPGHNAINEGISIPIIISTFPTKESIDNSINLNQIKINFSPDIKESQIYIDSFALALEDEVLKGYAVLEFTRYNQTGYHIVAVFNRLDADNEPLSYNKLYTASIDYDDLSNPAQKKTYEWSFKTEAEPVKEPGPNPKSGCFIDSIK